MRIYFLLLILSFPLLGSCSSAPSQSANIQSFQSVDLDGRAVQLDGALEQGKYVALVFWQHWCEPCLADAPFVQTASQEYRDQVAIFGVVSGPDQSPNDSELRATIQDLGLTYPQVRDRDGSWSRSLNIIGSPTVVVFAPNGEQIFRGRGLPNWDRVLK